MTPNTSRCAASHSSTNEPNWRATRRRSSRPDWRVLPTASSTAPPRATTVTSASETRSAVPAGEVGTKPRLGAIMPRHQTRTGDATTTRRLGSLGVAALLMIIVGSCSSAGSQAPTETVRELSWSRIALPESVAASSLAAALGSIAGRRARIIGRSSSGALRRGGVRARREPCRCTRPARTRKRLI